VKYGSRKTLRDTTLAVLVVSIAAYIAGQRIVAAVGFALAAFASLILYISRQKRLLP
jgi:hypothetical protein